MAKPKIGISTAKLERLFARQLISKRARRELLRHLDTKLPRLKPTTSVAAWRKQSGVLRRAVLENFLRGHPRGILAQKPRVRWTADIVTPHGYRIRKLLYEGYPGLWVPALLYEPTKLSGKVPVVLNPNGHHPGGKAMAHKQARCLNMAKRGMLALSLEFIGMGELRADADHNRIAHLDICGIAGVGVFYLLMKRGLDVLLAHPHADRKRVAVTGLSGGGWQTAVLSALDERVTAAIPVAGHSPVWQRTRCMNDIGDLEQAPSDFCAVLDYDKLTAMLAPRPTLLIYNRNDDCCFQTKRTRRSIYRPVKPYFELFGKRNQLSFHDNVDPGTHNYDSDNRSQLYRFLNRHFALDTPPDDLPWKEEVKPEAELNVGVPPENATLLSLAQHASRKIKAGKHTGTRNAHGLREAIAKVIKLPSFSVSAQTLKRSTKGRGVTAHDRVLRLGDEWSMPVTELVLPGAKAIDILICDGGRRTAARLGQRSLEEGRSVLAVDLFGTGECMVSWKYHMLLACTGERSLGIQVAQLDALIRWAARSHPGCALHLKAVERLASIIALLCVALKPHRIQTLTVYRLLDSLHRLIDWPVSYDSSAPLFCFGMLKVFDIPDLLRLCGNVPVQDQTRGPLA